MELVHFESILYNSLEFFKERYIKAETRRTSSYKPVGLE
jgi:hypothetical protein